MKTHIIYLRGNEFSETMVKDTIKSLNKFGIGFELFDGVVGRKGIEVLNSYNVKPSAHVNMADWTDGTLGCLASHYLLWDECSKQDQPFLILEQDAVIIRDPREILHLVETACHLDAYLPFNNSGAITEQEHFKAYNDAIKLYTGGVKKHPISKFYGDKSVTGSTFRGAYGYIITPKGAKEVLNFISRNGIFPADACLCSNATNIQRANSTYVRLNPFFETLDLQRKFSSR